MYFARRTIFIFASIFLFDWPYMQLFVHQALTLATLSYMARMSRNFKNKRHFQTEFTTELLLLFHSFLLVAKLATTIAASQPILDVLILVVYGLMILVNIAYMIYTIV